MEILENRQQWLEEFENGWLARHDWENYAMHMLKVMQQVEGLTNLASDGGFCERPGDRLLTKFEQRGLRLGNTGLTGINFFPPGIRRSGWTHL